MAEDFQDFEINGQNAGFMGLGIVALIIITIFDSLDAGQWIKFGDKFDSSKWIYTILLLVLVILSIKNIKIARDEDLPLQNGPVFFFVLIWLGINAFDNLSVMVDFYYFELSLKTINSLLILPLVLVWMTPHNSDNFFGFTEITDDTKRKSIWKISIVIMLLIRIFNLSTGFESFILLPLIAEPISIYNSSKGKPPLLTLHIQQELMDKFAVPISMGKGIVFILITFTFKLIYGNLWLLVILGYFGAAFVWLVDFVIPEEARNQSKSKDNEFDLDQFKESIISSKTKRSSDTKSKSKKVVGKNKKSAGNDGIGLPSQETTTGIAQANSEVVSVPNDRLGLSEDATIGEKAHALGRRMRTELQKPQYNLNHIMATLSKEDFTSAYKVPEDGLIFDSQEGNWSPPKDLILFPLELENYDYRRIDEILLLGFNRPIETSNAKINVNLGENSKYNTKISGNQIQVGDTTFHMKTLVLTRSQWEQAMESLEVVDDVEDISYTGFNTLQDLQEKLTQISEKWIELRKQAEEATVNFIAGLLGSQEPIFLGKDQVQLLKSSDVEVSDDKE